MTIAGHTWYLGRCMCGRMRSDLYSEVRYAMAAGKTLAQEDGIAHVGKCTAKEWTELYEAVLAEDIALQRSMASV